MTIEVQMDLGLTRCSKFTSSDLTRDAWAGLSHFQNVGVLADRICDLHQIPPKHRPFAVKQAAQIRYAMMQAREYAKAAFEVSLATKPVLLYYSAMSLALAELLFKNDGNSRLEKLREEHNCHGLQLSLQGNSAALPLDCGFEDLASQIVAKPQYGASGPKGTFEVWHRTSREAPLAGSTTSFFPSSQTSQTYFGIVLGAENTRPTPLPRSGINLLDCLRQIPGMGDALRHYGIPLRLVRARCRVSVPNAELSAPDWELEIMVHPGLAENFDGFCNQVKILPRWDESLSVNELQGNSVALNYLNRNPASFWDGDVYDGRASFSLPWGIVVDEETVYFSTQTQCLNEFGLYYASLHMLGNLARYYPDKWLSHIENHSPLAAVTETLVDLAAARMPLLLLSELRREYLVVSR